MRWNLLGAVLLAAPAALANPNHVRARVAEGGPVVVSCAPMTCGDDAAEARLRAAAQSLHDRLGARVVIVTAPAGFEPLVYAQAAMQGGLNGRDVVLAVSADQQHWVIQSQAADSAQLDALAAEAARAGGLEAGLNGVAAALPNALGALVAPAVAPAVPPAPSPANGPSPAPAPPPAATAAAAAPVEESAEGIPWGWVAAAVLALAALGVGWRIRARR